MKKYLSIAFLSIAFSGMSANAQNLQDFIDYTESDNQLAAEACLKQPVDNAVYDITLTHGDEGVVGIATNLLRPPLSFRRRPESTPTGM